MKTLPSNVGDWLAWILHFILGTIMGGLLGFYFVYHRRHGGLWLSPDLLLPYLSGTAMLGAGLATRWGNRLWIGDNYRIIPPDDPNHSRISRRLSVSMILAGTLLAAASLAMHFGLLPRPC